MKNKRVSDKEIYVKATKAIFSILNPWSIKMPKRAVPKAVEKTIKDVDKAFIEPMYLTP